MTCIFSASASIRLPEHEMDLGKYGKYEGGEEVRRDGVGRSCQAVGCGKEEVGDG